MIREITIRDLILHNLKKEYIEHSKMIMDLIDHINVLQVDYIINDSEKIKQLKNMNDIIKSLNGIYNKRINLLKTDNTNIINNDEDEVDEKSEKNDKNIKLSNVENLDNKIKNVVYSEEALNKLILSDEYKKIFPNDFDSIDTKLKDTIIIFGTKKLLSIFSLFDIQTKDINTDILNILSDKFIPVCVNQKSTKSKSKFKIARVNPSNKYEVLIDNFYEIEILNYVISGYFVYDNTNHIVKLSQINNQFIYDRKKIINTILNGDVSTLKINLKNSNKLTYISNDFKKIYLKNMTFRNYVTFDPSTFIGEVYEEYSVYQKYTSINNFKSLFSEFISSNLLTKFRIIKLLLSQNNNDAGLLFSYLKDKDTENSSVVIADLFYKNLNLNLQNKLHKSNIYIKNELEKIENLDPDDVDLKTQIILNKNMPHKVKKIAIEKLNEMKSGNSEFYKQSLFVKTLANFPWTGENDGDIFDIHKNDIFFNCLLKTAMISKHKDCRKKILK